MWDSRPRLSGGAKLRALLGLEGVLNARLRPRNHKYWVLAQQHGAGSALSAIGHTGRIRYRKRSAARPRRHEASPGNYKTSIVASIAHSSDENALTHLQAWARRRLIVGVRRCCRALRYR